MQQVPAPVSSAAPPLELVSSGYLHLGSIEGAPFGRLAGEVAIRLTIAGRTVLFIDHRRCPDQLSRVEVWNPLHSAEGCAYAVMVACDAMPTRARWADTHTLEELLRSGG